MDIYIHVCFINGQVTCWNECTYTRTCIHSHIQISSVLISCELGGGQKDGPPCSQNSSSY